VNLGKLTRQIKREALGSPKKAGALGLLCLVALYFWAPLVWGWVAPEDEPKAATATKAAKTARAERRPSTTPAGPNPRQAIGGRAAAGDGGDDKPPGVDYSWQQLDQWMQEDPLSKPPAATATPQGPAGTLLAQLLPWKQGQQPARDPFYRPAPPEPVRSAAEEQEQREQQARSIEVTPWSLNAKVTSTIVSPGGLGLAVVNGQVCRVGESVQLSDGQQTYEFKLEEVHRWGAMLARDGKTYPVEIPSPMTAGRGQ